MNWFVTTNAVLYLCASTYSALQGRLAWGFIYLCYGLSAFVLAYYVEGK